MPRRGKKQFIYQQLRGRYQFVRVSRGVSLFARMSPSGNIDADNSWSFAAVYIGDHSIDHFRFDFVRLATARLGKGGSFRCARRNSWIHDAFFSTTRILQSRVATKGNRWKNAARRDRIAYNCRELRWILGR